MAIFLHILPLRKNAIPILTMAIFPYGNFPIHQMKSLPLAAFNTLCILGSSLNYLQNNFLSRTNKLDNPEHKLSSLLRSQRCPQSFFGASRSSRNSRKQLEKKRNQVFDHFQGVTRGTNFFEGISGCIFCCPKISFTDPY